MRVDGRTEGGYRCSNASRGLCWNKTNPRRSVVHEKLGKAIAEKLLSLDGAVDLVITQVLALLENGPRSSHGDKLLKEKEKLERAHVRILEAIEASDKPIASLTAKLAQREHEIAQVDAELKTLETSGALCQQLPSKEQIKEAVMTKANALLHLNSSVRADLRQLVGGIRAVPYQQFRTSTVVLRAKFELRLAAILPNQILLLAKSDQTEDGIPRIQTVPMTVDLFELTRGPSRYWLAALDLHRKCLTTEEIAKELGTNRATANRSVRYATALCDAGLSDPFIELTDAPSRTGRWRFRAKNIRTIATETDEHVEPSRNDVREGTCQRVP